MFNKLVFTFVGKAHRLVIRFFTVFLNAFCIIVFLWHEIFFGFESACNYLRRVNSSCIVFILRLRGATIGNDCDIQSGIVFHNCKNFSNFVLGDNCHIGKDCFFDLRSEIKIEKNVVISMRSLFITHIDMTKSKLSEVYPARTKAILIEENVIFHVTQKTHRNIQNNQRTI